MKRTVIENWSGLYERYPHRDIEIGKSGFDAMNQKGTEYNGFYDIRHASNEPLSGSLVTEDSPF